MDKFQSTLVFLGGLTVGGAIVSLVMRGAAKSRSKHSAFVLQVEVKCKAGQRDQFVAAITPLAQHCESSEPETFSYKILMPRDEPDTVIIYERYQEEKSLGEVHQTSAPFTQFKADAKVWELVQEKSARVLIESSVGYM